MMPDEKERLLALFQSEEHWCKDAEARDGLGRPVKFHDPLATAWDITGALCSLFGWARACALFGQVERHVRGRKRAIRGFRRDDVIDSMVNLQAYNDRPETAFDVVHRLLRTMPVWNCGSRSPRSNVATATSIAREQVAPS